MIKFFYSPRSSASRVHFALEELGVPYEKVRVHLDKGEQKNPEFLAINPNGKVPALVDGDVKIFESLAILLHLGDRYGVEKNLWPKLGTPAHGDALSWTVWASTELAPDAIQHALHATDLFWALPKEKKSTAVAELARGSWGAHINLLDKRLAGRDWLLGSSFSLADAAIGPYVGMASMMCGLSIEGRANLGAWMGRIMARPAFGRVMSEQ